MQSLLDDTPLSTTPQFAEAHAQHFSSAAPVATLHRVTKRYDANLALDSVDLALYPGEVVALLGPNGAGKSTAVRLLLGLIAPTAGRARIFGSDPRDAASRGRTGAMLQVARIPETLTVREHVDLFRSYYGNPLDLREITHIAQLSGIETRRFGQLSGGQKQRVLFALAVCGNPDLIFLDEPTVGMDLEARRALWAAVRSLADSGKTVLLTTHYLEEADALADRIVVLNRGRIVSEGTPAEIKSTIAGRTIRCRTRLSPQSLIEIPGVLSAKQDRGMTNISATEVEGVVREMLFRDQTLSDLEVASPALEDAFLAITSTK